MADTDTSGTDHTTPGEQDIHRIEVEVRSEFMPEQSSQEQNRFVFSYHVSIENCGTLPAQLLSRHWIITDALGKTEEVRGDGVVGEQPLLTKGQSFTYTSACPLPTPTGTMHGTYQMIREDGHEFDAVVAPFRLTARHLIH